VKRPARPQVRVAAVRRSWGERAAVAQAQVVPLLRAAAWPAAEGRPPPFLLRAAEWRARSQQVARLRQVGRPQLAELLAVVRRPAAIPWQALEGSQQPGRPREQPEQWRPPALGPPALSLDTAGQWWTTSRPARAVHAKSARLPGTPGQAIWSRCWAWCLWFCTADGDGGACETSASSHNFRQVWAVHASRPASLLLGCIRRVCALVAPRMAGA
jgi:hypothetical protein